MKKHRTKLCALLVACALFAPACGRSAAEQKKLDVKLCFAAFDADLNAMKELLAKGADPNTKECGEYAKVGYPSPLFFALVGYRKEVKDLLAGSEMYDSGDNDRRRIAVLALLSAGANPNAKSETKAGETPLMYAEFLKSSSLVRALTEGGADPNARDAQGRTARDYGALKGEELQQMATGHVVLGLAIAMAQKDAAERDVVDEVAPGRK